MKLIVGLGNPGDEYRLTRHNLGFLAVDEFGARRGTPVDQKKKKTLFARCAFAGHDLVLMKPQTFMNLSGEAVLALASFFKVPPQEIVVLCDDIALPYGTLRVRPSGSAGGHNGLKSLIQNLGSDAFPRVRLGIGQPGERDLVDHVLTRFDAAEARELPVFIGRAADALEALLAHGVERAMNEFNGNAAVPR